MPKLSTVAAQSLLKVVEQEAQKRGWKVAISVFDITQRRLASSCPEDLRRSCVKHADDKALTALLFNRDTINFGYEVAGDTAMAPLDPLVKLTTIAAAEGEHLNFCPFAGGVLLYKEGEVVGAIGVSGQEELEDHDLALKARAACAA